MEKLKEKVIRLPRKVKKQFIKENGRNSFLQELYTNKKWFKLNAGPNMNQLHAKLFRGFAGLPF